MLKKTDYPTLDYGEIDAEIHGNLYDHCQSMLKTIYKNAKGKDVVLTLTPPCQYQIEKGWPELPFVNVNLYGSKATEKDNWLGYIPIDFSDIDFGQIIKDNGNVNVHAHIEKNESYEIILNVDSKYTMLTSNISHDQKQVDYLTQLASEIDGYYIDTTAKRLKDKPKFVFIHDKKIIAEVSAKKIDDWLDGYKMIDNVRVKIDHFRYDYENHHYSKANFVKKIIL